MNGDEKYFKPSPALRRQIIKWSKSRVWMPNMVEKAVARWAVRVVGRAKSHYLMGAALKRDTGTLGSDVKYKIKRAGMETTALVGTNLWYGKLWEDGYVGVVGVKAHSRRGKPVRAHTRRINLEARPWLRPSIEDTAPAFEKDLEVLGKWAIASPREGPPF